MQVNSIAPQKQPSFGSMASVGKKILNSNTAKKVSDAMEFDNFSMSVPCMMGMLYGATIMPRLIMADDKHDRREVLLRDVTSVTAILFGAKALSRGFSKMYQKKSGFVLNEVSQKATNFGQKMKQYFSYGSKGMKVMNSEELVSKYSKLQNYKNGFDGFCEYINKKGGDLKKVLSFDKGVKENVEKIVGKKVETFANSEDLATAIKGVNKNGSKELDAIYNSFEKSDNKFVKYAQAKNSTFNFAATLLLIPALMIGIQEMNEKLTKHLVKKESAKKGGQQPQPAQQAQSAVAFQHTETAKKAFSQFLK